MKSPFEIQCHWCTFTVSVHVLCVLITFYHYSEIYCFIVDMVTYFCGWMRRVVDWSVFKTFIYCYEISKNIQTIKNVEQTQREFCMYQLQQLGKLYTCVCFLFRLNILIKRNLKDDINYSLLFFKDAQSNFSICMFYFNIDFSIFYT